jgi:A/G-specific adenine glycosylase
VESPDLNDREIEEFRETIRAHFREKGRSFAWRETRDPYKILVSEFMLQQTQTERVVKKYGPFLARFPSFESLAGAGVSEVYELWKGLGYNRRAKALRDTALRVVEEHDGRLPEEPALLQTFPGIGPYTASAICAFAFDKPLVFLETNIRRVFIHYYFADETEVHDKRLLPLIEATLDRDDPRSWYYALMDYGADLKGRVPNPNTRSAHYTRQSPFENSNRQIRGRILASLAESGPLDEGGIAARVGFPADRVRRSLVGLEEDGMLVHEAGSYRIP